VAEKRNAGISNMGYKLCRRIKLKHGVKTKGINLKKGQIVTLVEWPKISGRNHYPEFCTVSVKGYGRVAVPKSVLHKTARKKVLSHVYRYAPFRRR